MIRHWILTVFIVSSVLWACQQPMDPASSISKFRVLAVQTEPPEVRPGETVTHRALTADPDGEGRQISYLWITCLGLLTPSTGASGCTTPLNFKVGNTSDGGDVYEVTVPPNALDQMQEGDTFLQATTIVSLCAGGTQPSLEDLITMDPTTMNFDDLCKDGEGVVSFKTFRISEADEANRNTNPIIAGLNFNHNRLPPLDPATGKPKDTTLSSDDNSSKCKDSSACLKGTELKPNTFYCDTLSDCLDGVDIDVYLTHSEADDSFEFYEEKINGQMTTKDEAPYVSWFADGGELSQDRSRTEEPPGPFTVKWSPPQAGGEFTLYVAAHDLRGGTSWRTYSIAAVTAETK